MSNGYVVATPADSGAAREIAAGFGLDVIDAAGDSSAVVAALAGAANVGVLLSQAAAADAGFAALLRLVVARLERAQLILLDDSARAAFGFIPETWPQMGIDVARTRIAALRPPPAPEAASVQPEPPAPAPVQPEPSAPIQTPAPEPEPEPEVIAAEPAPAPAQDMQHQDDPQDIAPEPEDVSAADISEPTAPETDESEDEEDVSPEAARAFVREQMREFYNEKQHLIPIRESVDARGLRAFATETLAHPEIDEEASEAALVVRTLMRLALASLHAQGIDATIAGFGAVAAEAARLAGAGPDAHSLADKMLAASALEQDPMTLVSEAVERLVGEAAPPPISSMDEAEKPDAWSEDGASPSHAEPAPVEPEPEAAESEAPTEPPPGGDLGGLLGGHVIGGVVGGLTRDAEEAASDDAPAAASPAPPASAPLPRHVSPPEPAPQPQAPPEAARKREESFGSSVDMYSSVGSHAGGPLGESAPADASAFAPKKLRRDTPELVRIVIHQPKDLKAVIKAARKADPSTDAAPQSMGIGDIALGAKIGVSLDVKGAVCDGAIQRRTWTGAPADFNFTVEAEAGAKQAVLLARVFIDDAQIGVLAFTRKISGPAKKAASDGERVRLKRHKRVFLSYSSADRETVAKIATAYQMAGVEHFFDRTSLKSGEQWSPRLRKEIDRSDLFHLCWSKAAAGSEWVEKEAEHALTRQRRSNGKNPAITVQMLDGPPWAPHPPRLDSINFDDFVRAAIVGYARGEGES